MVYMLPKRKHGEVNENKPKNEGPSYQFFPPFSHDSFNYNNAKLYVRSVNRAFLKFRLGFKRNFVLNKEFEE
ncbi:hypothetical protein BAMY_08725 [Bacillus amyloliquefaciens]|nr:hypothetical protein BAMY_08725 [Bacillus amyloliquefaciens]AVX17284.1 hypothetical protein C5I45_10575 [Bacillus sp. ZY-1-1]AWM83174.1 hypothetical protein B7L90_08015 [Bacillus velezensis]